MKTALFLAGDYWHHAQTIKPLADKLFSKDIWNVIFTENPQELLTLDKEPDLIITFKDPIENNQIPTPVWCNEEWTNKLFNCVEKHGTGILFVHAAVADLDKEHPIVKEMIQSVFVSHPEQCPLTFKRIKEHAVLKDVSEFMFPEHDEHYVMSMIENAQVEVIAYTQSKNGTQPGMWVKELGKGKICCITPGHTAANLLCEEYVKVLKNAVNWCCKWER